MMVKRRRGGTLLLISFLKTYVSHSFRSVIIRNRGDSLGEGTRSGVRNDRICQITNRREYVHLLL